MSNKVEDKTMKPAAKRALVPKLRFPEFRDAGEWAEKKLIDTTDKKIRWSFIGGPFGSNLKSSDYVDEGVRIIQLQNIGDAEFIDDYRIFTSEEKADELLSNNIYPGDIILSKMGDPVGRACLIPDTHNRYVMCSDGIRLVVDEKINSKYFIYLLINSKHFRPLVEKTATGSTRKRIGLDELKNLPILLPKKSEQQKIADCLASLDELITLEAQKLDTLKTHKKGLMQQLFPAEGETLPKLRFPEFREAGEWERKQLREITSEFLDGDWIESKDQSNKGIRLLQTGNVGVGIFIPKVENSRYIPEETFHRLHCEEVFPGDCLISRLPDPAGRSCLVPEIGQRMITAVDCTIVRFDKQQIIPYIFVLYSQTDQYFQEVSSLCSGSTRQRISRENLAQLTIALPEIREQQKIADCLSSLDELITLEAQKLDTLKTHKKWLMQQLFPALDEVQE